MAEQYQGSERFIDLVLDDGTNFRIRPMTIEDREALKTGISKMSFQSRYFRFFSGFAEAPSPILDGLSNVDGQSHIAWCAIDMTIDNTPAIAAVHAIRDPEIPNKAEIAFAVIDDYHHRGIARLLLAAVIMDARDAGIDPLSAEVLAENKPAARLFRALGAETSGKYSEVLSFDFSVTTALEALHAMQTPKALQQVLSG